MFADYLSLRGGATGTEYNYSGRDLFGIASRTGSQEYNQPYSGFFRTYYLQDSRKNNVLFPQFEADNLGGDRGDLRRELEVLVRLHLPQLAVGLFREHVLRSHLVELGAQPAVLGLEVAVVEYSAEEVAHR